MKKSYQTLVVQLVMVDGSDILTGSTDYALPEVDIFSTGGGNETPFYGNN